MMKAKALFATCILSLALASAPSSAVRADDEIEIEIEEREAVGVTKGPRCTFTRAEKLGMLLWLFPLAGAVYTPFACKKDVFSKKVDVDAD